MKNSDELFFGLNPLDPSDGLSDLDDDGLSLSFEYYLGTNHLLADTDGDMVSDSLKVLQYATDPLKPSSKPTDQTANKTSNASASQSSVIPNAATTTTTPLLLPSLSNGDFTQTGIRIWRDYSLGDFQGKTFKWGQGPVNSWSSYMGSSIEVWQAEGESFVELDGAQGHSGIKQAITNPQVGRYILNWLHCGRNNPKAGDNAYSLRIYYIDKSGKEKNVNAVEHKGLNTKVWEEKFFSFNITQTEFDAAATANSQFYVAYTVGDNNTFGALIDKVNLMYAELKDVNGQGIEDDVRVLNWVTGQPIKKNHIAYIDAHQNAENGDPRMPQLEFKIHGLPSGLAIEAKLSVTYERGNGLRRSIIVPEDRVRIPINGNFRQLGEVWKLYEDADWITELNGHGFFGGEAIVKYQIKKKGEIVHGPQTINFRIGGENPDDGKCRAYIDGLDDAGAEGNLWFAYAIAKSETPEFNGPGTLYNQFWEVVRDSKDLNYNDSRLEHAGWPTFGNDDDGPGGYGIFQVTGTASSGTDNITRKPIWNWKANIDAGMAILRVKRGIADEWMTSERFKLDDDGEETTTRFGQRPQAREEKGEIQPVPNRLVGHVLFSDVENAARYGAIEDAVTMKIYNSAIKHYCYWENDWKYNNTNGKSFDYVARVCSYVDVKEVANEED